MQKTGIAVAIVLCFAQTAYSEYLRIVGQTWIVGSGFSCSVTLEIENTGPPDVLLSGWQLVLQIIPVGDAPGNVFFDNLSDYTPTDYVFRSQSFGISRSGASQTLATFLDFSTAPDGGVHVQPPNNNLLQFSLISPDAVGTYDIVLAPCNEPDIGSHWLDSYWGAHAFDVTPPPERPDDVVATVVFSAIPEPPNGLMLVSGVVALMLLGVAGRRCPHCAGLFCCQRIVGSYSASSAVRRSWRLFPLTRENRPPVLQFECVPDRNVAFSGATMNDQPGTSILQRPSSS